MGGSPISLSSGLFFRDERRATEAFLDLVGRPVHLFRQAGSIPPGGQSVLPGGELSLLTNGHGEYDINSRHALNGRIPLAGQAIVHRGRCPCAALRSRPENTARGCALASRYVDDSCLSTTFQMMNSVAGSDAVLCIQDGVITAIEGKSTDPGRRALAQLLEMDSRYSKVHEIGIGINRSRRFRRSDNFMPNEMRRGLHIGLGLTPYTDFHIDIACSDVQVYAADGPFRESLVV